MKISRVWAMPDKNTFSIKPIGELIAKHLHGYSVDPFANSNTLATVTNDIDPQFKTNLHLDAFTFLQTFSASSVDVVLFDPPYSQRQVAESYKKLGLSVNMETTQGSYWRKLKEEISRIMKIDGVCVTCSWNSGGVGIKYGFEIVEILIVPHGSWHNDTIVVVEKKVDSADGEDG